MGEAGRQIGLTDEQLNKLRHAVAVLKANDTSLAKKLRAKRMTKLREGKSNLRRIVRVSKCCICNERRALEICHIVPVHISSEVDGYKYLGGSKENTVVLCKNHHWCFDHKLLTDAELEFIYREAKEFIDNVLLEFWNTGLKPNPNMVLSTFVRNSLERFNDWRAWTGRVFFTKVL